MAGNGIAGDGFARPAVIRVLFVGEAITLAHVVRPLALSRMLDTDQYHVGHAWDPRYETLTGRPPDIPLWTIPARQFDTALHRGTPIYRYTDLLRYVTDDLAAIERFRPDVVVGDFRLSLDVSTRVAGVRHIAIANAYWSPHAIVTPAVPDGALSKLFGVRAGQRLFDLGTPAFAAWHARAYRRLYRRFGLPDGPRDIRDMYTRGATVCYADIAELVPLRRLPDGHRFLGPIPWSPDTPQPPPPDDHRNDRPLIYVTLGSSGDAKLLPTVLEGLSDLPVRVLAATAGAQPPQRTPAHAQVVRWLPGDQITAQAAVVIGNGGSPTTYQGLRAGAPVIGICGNLDQYLNMSLVEQSGAGVLLRSGRLSAPLVADTVRRVLADRPMRQRAGELATAIAGYHTANIFQEAIKG